MSDVAVARFISTVALHFPRPKFAEDTVMEAAWVASMNRVLGGYSDEVLAEAAHRILRDRVPKKDGRFFPAPAECSDVCSDVARALRAKETPLLANPAAQMPYAARCELACDLMKTPLGIQARKEGWDTAMFYFCVANAKAPMLAKDIEECKRSSRAFKDEVERCKRGERELGGAWARYAESMVRKARELMEKPA